MAFELSGWNPAVSQRGGPAVSYYVNEDDATSAIEADNYFNHNEVRSFVLKQAKTPATVGIPVLCRSSTENFILELVMSDAGVVTAKTAASGAFSIT